MPETYAEYQFRLRVLSPVAAHSPFDSDTLWGRLVCALMVGSTCERDWGERWLQELRQVDAQPLSDWRPPVLVSEGFLCDHNGTPWLPLPFAARLKLEHGVGPERRKAVKKIESVPLGLFARTCLDNISLNELVALRADYPSPNAALHPHLAMNRASGTGVDGMLFMSATDIYSSPHRKVPQAASADAFRELVPAEIVFFLRLRADQNIELIEAALRRICAEGWGNSKSRGLGSIEFGNLQSWEPPAFAAKPDAFVSLSSFCPAAHDPTDGLWKVGVKNSVPPQFVDGRRVLLGEETSQKWRVKSFLRLRAGSCFRLSGGEMRSYYGRMLNHLLEPAEDAEGKPLPPLFHYALAFPVPMRWPEN